MDAERGLQAWFSKIVPLAIMIPPLIVLLFAWFVERTPDREELGTRRAEIRLDPVRLDAAAFGPLRLVGAWRLTSNDERVGGISALVAEPAGLTALNDSGVWIRFPRPHGNSPLPAEIGEVARGPAPPNFKRHRDTEAMVADPQGRGWWVAFEVHHQLWLYEAGSGRALERISFGRRRWPQNTAIEALAAGPDGLLVIPEDPEEVFEIAGSQALRVPISGSLGLVSDSVMLPDDQLLLLERQPAWHGFANALVWLRREERLYRTGRRVPLPLGPLDNAEAIAIEPIAGGALRLWLMTDDNFQRPMRTLLVAIDMPAELVSTERGTP